jgi:hypothetical protein
MYAEVKQMESSWADRLGAIDAVSRFFHFLDRDQMSEAAELFTPDGRFVRGGQTVEGSHALFGALKMKPAGQIVRHLMSNAVADLREEGILVRYDLSVYIQRAGEECAGAPNLAYIVNGSATCTRMADRWAIANMLTEQAFRTPVPLFN